MCQPEMRNARSVTGKIILALSTPTKLVLTGKNPGGMGPPGRPSFGGICPNGLGAGPAF
mgnify:CR=1 FL=1